MTESLKVEEMAENESFKTALAKSMAICSRREFCRDDIRNKLKLWDVDENDSGKIIDVLEKENFLNESRYATAFVRDKFKYNKWGKVKIAIHLKAKNIPSEIIKSALDSIDNEIYIKFIKENIALHKKSVKAKNQYDLKAKLMRYGLSKGFENNILYDILNDIED
ncbi:MAG TPA: regulatory protein RecX [Bacteroidales bacterium]|nr:regulatory protein RecX [Bacteroidales bacterium]